MKSPARMAAARIPVPVAESQLSLKTASSGLVGLSEVGEGTTGGARTTRLCNPAIWNLGSETSLRNFFIFGAPQTNTSTLNNSHGTQASQTRDRAGAMAGLAGACPKTRGS